MTTGVMLSPLLSQQMQSSVGNANLSRNMMRNRIRYFLIALVASLSTACSDSRIHDDASPLLAVVNGIEIREADIDYELQQLPESLRRQANPETLRGRVLQQLIRRHALSQKAIDNGLDVEPSVRRKIRRARDEILIQEMKARFLQSRPEPTDAEVKRYFATHRQRYASPEMLHLRQIQLPDRETAIALWNRLRKRPEKLDAAIQDLGRSKPALRVSDLGWMPFDAMPVQWRQAFGKSMKSGDISRPVETEGTWTLFVLLAHKPAQMPDLKRIRPLIVADMQHDQWEAQVATILQHTPVRIVKPETRKAIDGIP